MGTHDRDLPSEEVILDTDDEATKETKKQLTKTREEKVSQQGKQSTHHNPAFFNLRPFNHNQSCLAQ